MPMAVLVATLYAFSRLAAENEITAMKAGGISLRSVLTPVLWAALGVTLFMVAFNDQVLPRANHRLRTLQGRHRAEEADIRIARAGHQRSEPG